MSAAEKLSAIAANVPLVYAAGRGTCQTRHFVTTVPGNGSGVLEVQVPFVPDYIAVCGYDPRVMAQADSVLMFSADTRALSHLAGLAMASKDEAPYSAGLSHSAVSSRYACGEDGTVKIYDLPCFAGVTAAKFLAGVDYVVIAQKYTDQTDLARVTEFVQSLAGKSGTLKMSKKIVTGAFPGADEKNAATGESSNEAWNALLREYASGCTIALA